ncbi:hypothetical protein [Streptomyces sp. NPDC059455]|uniref:hypothetical protein n=1 Tax=Streptomyces sp. NPDC059455 TaxID=3346837 RepID=UPI00367BA868
MVAPGWIVTSIKDLTKRMEWLDSLGVHKARMRVRDDKNKGEHRSDATVYRIPAEDVTDSTA